MHTVWQRQSELTWFCLPLSSLSHFLLYIFHFLLLLLLLLFSASPTTQFNAATGSLAVSACADCPNGKYSPNMGTQVNSGEWGLNSEGTLIWTPALTGHNEHVSCLPCLRGKYGSNPGLVCCQLLLCGILLLKSSNQDLLLTFFSTRCFSFFKHVYRLPTRVTIHWLVALIVGVEGIRNYLEETLRVLADNARKG